MHSSCRISPPLSVIVLAGGHSLRMGTDKALLPIGGTTLLERTVETVHPLTDDIIVVGRSPLENAQAPVRFIPDGVAGAGPLGGLHAGLVAVRHSYVVCVACDLPFLNADLLLALARIVRHHDAVVPRTGGRAHPLHAVYQRNVKSTIESQLSSGNYRMTHLLERLNVRWVDEPEIDAVDPTRQSLLNVNTPEEWRTARGAIDE